MTQEELNELGIHSLRNLARKSGVHSPTTKKKEELIHEIIEIDQGRQQPYVSKTKQGRPPKRDGMNLGGSLLHGIPFSALQSSVAFKQTPIEFSYEDFKTIQGYVEIVEHNAALLWIRKGTKYESCYIPSSFVEAYNLMTGDLLLTKISMSDNQLIVSDIFNINNCPINKYNKNRPSYYSTNHISPANSIEFKDLNFSNLDIKFGQNIYFYGNNNEENTKILSDLINSSNADQKIYINTTIVEKNRNCLDNLQNVEIFATDITEDINVTKRLINIASERAKRLYEMDKSVIIAVDDVSSLALAGDDLSCARNVMSLTKNNGNGSIGIFAIMSKDNKFNIFERLADKRFAIENNQLFLID
ncbi:MAG: hypothetical protein IKA36_04640 [Clostridia bacterium]|nr:hypothetical protein [Clostridia bacterium]